MIGGVYMDEVMVSKLLELGIISGGFVYLLYFITNKISKTLEDIASSLKDVSATNAGMLETLNMLNMRVSTLESQQAKKEE